MPSVLNGGRMVLILPECNVDSLLPSARLRILFSFLDSLIVNEIRVIHRGIVWVESVVPIKVLRNSLDALFHEIFFFLVSYIEVGSVDTDRVDIHSPMPIIAV